MTAYGGCTYISPYSRIGSHMGKILDGGGKSTGKFVGPYRAAIFAAWRDAQFKGIQVELVFASWPDVPGFRTGLKHAEDHFSGSPTT